MSRLLLLVSSFSLSVLLVACAEREKEEEPLAFERRLSERLHEQRVDQYGTLVVMVPLLAVHEQPSAHSTVRGHLKRGDRVIPFATRGGWTLVSLEGAWEHPCTGRWVQTALLGKEPLHY